MLHPRSRRFSSAHVMAALALFVSLGGTSYAVATLPKNSVGSAQVKNGSLTTKDLAKGVTTSGPPGPRGPRGGPGPSTVIPRVSALPSAPADGQEVYFQNDAMTSAGLSWHLRYSSDTTGPHKWQFIGGSSLAYDAGSATHVTNKAETNIGNTVVVPATGVYDVEVGAPLIRENTASGFYLTVGLYRGASSISGASFNGPAGPAGAAVLTKQALALAAGDALQLKYQMANGTDADFYGIRLSLTPRLLG